MKTNTLAPTYRPEIDGLRAIAVLAVVFFHFSVPIWGGHGDGHGVGGGMVGVDIFFVISGFLIGGILLREHANTGRIALGRFYLRRIRRLAPAYFAMAAVSLLAAWAILLPFEFRAFGKALIASTTYLANVHFFRETGYFDIGVENKILLHNWSLAVEEQFYVFLPFLILALGFSQRVLRSSLVVIFAVSLGACIWLTPVNQAAAFYLFPLRAWELLAGVLLAIWVENRDTPLRIWPSWLGLALIAMGILWAKPGATFPGWQVLVPVLGTVLMLAGRQDANPVNRVLAAPIPVFFGRISYSLYLWHWPVLTLSLYWRGSYGSAYEAGLWLALAMILATLSWRFVEQPVRISPRFTAPRLVGMWLFGSAALVAIGGVIYLKDGITARFSPEIRSHIQASADFLQDWSRCHTPAAGPYQGLEICPIGPDGPPEVLIWGDSHIRPLHAALAQAADTASKPAVILWAAGCPPFFGVTKVENTTNSAEDLACTQTIAGIQTLIETGQAPPHLLLVGRWSYYAQGHGTGLDVENTVTLTAIRDMLPADTPPADTGNKAIYQAALSETLTGLSAAFRQVFVLRQPPEIPNYDSRAIAREMAHGRLNAAGATAEATVPRGVAEARAADGLAPLLSAENRGEITLLDPWAYFCDASECSALQASRAGQTGQTDQTGQALYFDNNHLTNSGGRHLGQLFAPVFTPAFAPVVTPVSEPAASQ